MRRGDAREGGDQSPEGAREGQRLGGHAARGSSPRGSSAAPSARRRAWRRRTAPTRSPAPAAPGIRYGKGPLHVDDPDYPGRPRRRLRQGRRADQRVRLRASRRRRSTPRSRRAALGSRPTWARHLAPDRRPAADRLARHASPGHRGRWHADRRHRRLRVLATTTAASVYSRSTDDGRIWQQGDRRARRCAVLPPRGRPDRPGADLLRLRRSACSAPTNTARSFTQRQAADRRLRGRLRSQAELLLRQHGHGRRRAAEGHVRPRGRGRARHGRLAGTDGAPNFQNKPDAPANGLYRSTTGAPGSFNARCPTTPASRRPSAPAGRSSRSPTGPTRTPTTSTRSSRTASCSTRPDLEAASRTSRCRQRRPCSTRSTCRATSARRGPDGEPPGVLQPGQQVRALPAHRARHRAGLPGDVQPVHRARPAAPGRRRANPRDPRAWRRCGRPARRRACRRAATRSST